MTILEVARQLVARKQLERCVGFIDQVPVHELPRLLAGVDVGLVPNRASNATHHLPVKLLDYMALGIPTIAARLRTIEHYFSEHEVRFFEPGDTAALAAAMKSSPPVIGRDVSSWHTTPAGRWSESAGQLNERSTTARLTRFCKNRRPLRPPTIRSGRREATR